MLTGKQRSYLKSLANNIDPTFQIGKNGLTDNFIKQVEEAIESRELIKIKILFPLKLNIHPYTMFLNNLKINALLSILIQIKTVKSILLCLMTWLMKILF